MGVRKFAPNKEIWDFVLSKENLINPDLGEIGKQVKRSFTSEMAKLANFLLYSDRELNSKSSKDKLCIPGIAYFESDGTLHTFIPDSDSLYPFRDLLVCFDVMES